MGKSGELLALNFNEGDGGQPLLTFWTIEADPSEDVERSKKRLGAFLRDDPDFKNQVSGCHLVRELSKKGYHHFHLVMKFKKKVRYPARVKKIQEFMKFDKPNGKAISVRVFKTRQGSTEDYGDLVKYVKEKKYKTEDVDQNVLCLFNNECFICNSLYDDKKGMYSCTETLRHRLGFHVYCCRNWEPHKKKGLTIF